MTSSSPADKAAPLTLVENEKVSTVVSEKSDSAAVDDNNNDDNNESALERLASRVSANYPVEGGIEPLAAGAVSTAIVEERPHHNYWFKRLDRDMPLPSKPRMAAMIAALFLVMFLTGWNDGSQGPLLPSLQEYYKINYLTISIIWICSAFGFFLAGLSNVWLTDRFGFGIVAPFGAFSQMAAYSLMCWGGPYPLFCVAFVIVGFGLGVQDAQVNSMLTRMPNANTLMFLMHAMYGLGATASPLVTTQFVKHVEKSVYYYYAASLGLAALTCVLLLVVFQLRTDDQVVGRRTEAPTADTTGTADSPAVTATSELEMTPATTTDATVESAQPPSPHTAKAAKPPASGSKMKRIGRSGTIYIMSFYILIYVGVEVGIGGWATSFLINVRGGDNSAGYVSSGYFGGLTLGRVVFIPLTGWVGQWNAVYAYTLGAIALEVVVWTVKSVVGDAVAFAFVGLLLGPIYPIVMMVVVAVIPEDIQGGTIGILASMGQVGSALIPFITGGIAQHKGPWILQPLMIALMAGSLALWVFVPRRPIRA